MNQCPNCGTHENQVKNGRNSSGSQRYQCKNCRRIYTPEPTPMGYESTIRDQAVQLYLEGINLRRIGRILGVNHQSVANWVEQHANAIPDAPLPTRVATAELDELFTFIGDKKNIAYLMTVVDRTTRCFLGWAVGRERSEAILQQRLDTSPYATTYDSDVFLLYQAGIYAGTHHAMSDKRQTFSVEGGNAELRHYLARLARRSRCFSRSLRALYNAVKLFVYAWNRRQLAKHRFPAYPAHLLSFAI